MTRLTDRTEALLADAFAEEIGVSATPGVLLDHVHEVRSNGCL